MRKAVGVFFGLALVTSSAGAQSFENLLTPDTIITACNNYFKDYLKNFTDWMRVDITEHTRIVHQDKGRTFTQTIVRTVGPRQIQETIYFHRNSAPAGSVTLTRTGDKLVPVPDLQLFTGEFPLPSSAETYRLTWNQSRYWMFFKNDHGRQSGVINMDYCSSPTQLQIKDFSGQKRIVRSYQFTWKSMFFPGLYAERVRSSADSWEEYYYSLPQGTRVSLQEFLAQYKEQILGALLGLLQVSILNYAASNSWPWSYYVDICSKL